MKRSQFLALGMLVWIALAYGFLDETVCLDLASAILGTVRCAC